MSGPLRLAWHYLRHDRIRSALLILAIALVAVLPLAVSWLVDRASDAMRARARQTPVVVGAPGSRFDLVLDALHFRGRAARATTYGEALQIRAGGLAEAIPIHRRHETNGVSIVATSHDYFAFRGLRVARGRLPGRLGECVVGADAAACLGVGPGDTLLSDDRSPYGFDLRHATRLPVVGVLATSDGPDDSVVFTDIRTGWILDGIGHGHEDVEDLPASSLLRVEASGKHVLDLALAADTRVTAELLERFHFHGEEAGYPLTAVIAIPTTPKDSVLLRGRYLGADPSAQALVPLDVIEELLGFVFQLKRFFDAQTGLVLLATGLLLVLVVLLTLRARHRELATLRRIGASRATVAQVIGWELLLLVLGGVIVAGLLAGLLVQGLAAGLPGGLG